MNWIFKLCLLLILTNSFCFSQSEQKIVNIGDFILLSQDTIKQCKIGYRTFGTPNIDSTNIIMYLTWFGGNSNEIGSLVNKYKLIDTSRYFIIAIDALGNGISSSPSNYSFGDSSVYKISIKDMVNSQHVLLREYLGINHLYGAIGGSMGGMQVLEWSVLYPEFIDKIIPYVTAPRLTSYDLLWMNTQLNLIEISNKYGVSEKEIRKMSDMLTEMYARTPDYINESIKTDDFQNYLTRFNKEPNKIFTLQNYVAQLKAMMKHNIYSNYCNSMEETARHIKAKMFFIISDRDMMIQSSETYKLAKFTDSKILSLKSNCGHLAVGCEIDLCREEIAKFLMAAE